MNADERKRRRELTRLTAACPRCGRMRHADGEFAVGSVAAPIFSCDVCTDSVAVGEEFMDLPVSFWVNQHGESEEIAGM